MGPGKSAGRQKERGDIRRSGGGEDRPLRATINSEDCFAVATESPPNDWRATDADFLARKDGTGCRRKGRARRVTTSGRQFPVPLSMIEGKKLLLKESALTLFRPTLPRQRVWSREKIQRTRFSPFNLNFSDTYGNMHFRCQSGQKSAPDSDFLTAVIARGYKIESRPGTIRFRGEFAV